jgi:hypothetical protein
MFSIDTDPKRRLIRISVSGMLTTEEVTELYRQEYEAIRAMGCPMGSQLVLVDLRECPLQLQDVVGAFQREMHSPNKAKRLAMVTGGSLSRMQARRIMQRDDAQLFDTMAEAETWLFGNQARVAA